jgi:hypothetical protein
VATARPVNAVQHVGDIGTAIGQVRLHRHGEAAVLKVERGCGHKTKDVKRFPNDASASSRDPQLRTTLFRGFINSVARVQHCFIPLAPFPMVE